MNLPTSISTIASQRAASPSIDRNRTGQHGRRLRRVGKCLSVLLALLALGLTAGPGPAMARHKIRVVYRTRIVYRTPLSCAIALTEAEKLVAKQRVVLATGAQGFAVWFATLSLAAAELDQLTAGFNNYTLSCREAIAAQERPAR